MSTVDHHKRNFVHVVRKCSAEILLVRRSICVAIYSYLMPPRVRSKQHDAVVLVPSKHTVDQLHVGPLSSHDIHVGLFMLCRTHAVI
jgi:hypothetical protein